MICFLDEGSKPSCPKPSPVTEPMHSIDLNNNSNSAALQLMDNVLHNNDSPPPIVVDVENDLSVHTSNTNIKSTPQVGSSNLQWPAVPSNSGVIMSKI